MAHHSRAGQTASPADVTDISHLVSSYYTLKPNAKHSAERVSFGTSGHRGCAFSRSFNESHILAIAQAVVDYRQMQGFDGPMYLGFDTHGLSQPAFTSVLQVLAANGVTARVQEGRGFVATPVISHAILNHNRQGGDRADGLILTPSHNPPQDGGIKYNPPHGGPADTDATGFIAERANAYLSDGLSGVQQVSLDVAMASGLIESVDIIGTYVEHLADVIDFDAIRGAKLKIGVDPMGGSGVHTWPRIAAKYNIDIEVVNPVVDAAFAFMPLDKDGKIRMDCSSPFAMTNLLKLKDDFDISIGNDPDFDRHGIVCRDGGLMNPNHYLAVAIDYLLGHRPNWRGDLPVGKTLVSSAIIDRVVASYGRQLMEVPVGFKWFVSGLHQGNLAFGGEESAGASFLDKQGQAFSTDKDGFILGLLAAEVLAVTGQSPAARYRELEQTFGQAFYRRLDAPANDAQKSLLKAMEPEQVQSDTLAGEAIVARLTQAPGNGAAIGGLKVTTENGWFAARPSGTEAIYKIYAESLKSEAHLELLLEDAKALVSAVFEAE
ncbi:phosphoglucomutase (alpha-D-glucose-1,6-bisphosphate-dependent) [Ferrimonas sp. SCSIO 43195]|uniref:phosphoglucomutase (alpha-D-glucose-1,6-bisphosphate-dependent) n=1 Tax=Ferrimonas sp. SCSIO 43195 TaxID=2822844 RepID=UPI0020760BDB|nr:phosphoglucomutase (alpha-D-glucose-1,6-bisphosphate-dependent) [Ferrimonas sp. SCSIO 43195]USD36302.1 phosphoglucomutase (alpha-D-glucose-1,6-bisphosphate-dependent) [Ferrimonas sp. SCSIO 43195]